MLLSQGTKRLIEDLVKKTYNGEVMLPDFQRSFVWRRQNIEELIVSLLENSFIGTFLIYHINPNDPPFKTIPIAGVNECNPDFDPKPNILILDGQQRLTSLFYVLYQPNFSLKNTSYPYRFFLDITKLLQDELEDAVFSWSIAWRGYKGLVGADGEYKLKSLIENKILPLSFLKEDFSKRWYKDLKEYGLKDNESEKIYSYIKNIIDYQVLTLDVPVNTPAEKIAVLFERINRTGMKLSIFDLLTARLYKFINLRSLWEESFERSEFVRKFAIDKRDTTTATYLLQALMLTSGYSSIKAKDMLRIDESVVNKDRWEEGVEAFGHLLQRLMEPQEYGIGDIRKWMPYRPMVVVMLALLLYDKDTFIGNLSKVKSWYFASIFSERFSGSTETKLVKDYKELLEWFGGGDIPEAVAHLRQNLQTLSFMDKNKSGTALYKGVFNLLFMQEAKDFFSGDKIRFNELDDHHIFPKKFLEEKGIGKDKEIAKSIDCVLNRTLISSKTNRKISKKAPGEYIEEMIEIYGRERVEGILKEHFIDRDMMQLLLKTRSVTPISNVKEQFYEFIKLRERNIKKYISQLVEI